jgi:hypothetical protein
LPITLNSRAMRLSCSKRLLIINYCVPVTAMLFPVHRSLFAVAGYYSANTVVITPGR